MAPANSGKTTSETIPLEEMFRDKRFTIPEIQRDYDWEKKKQVSNLLKDLWRYHTFTKKEVPQYFLGTVIVYDSRGKDNFQIMDGQQRVTTLLALAAAIKSHIEHYAKTSGAKRKAELTKFIQEEIEDVFLYYKIKPRRTWRLTPKDDSVVEVIKQMSTLKGRSPEDVIVRPDEPNGQRLYDALVLFHKESLKSAKKHNPSDPYPELMEFFRTISQNVVVTMTTTRTLSIALQMYISVNGPNSKELNKFDLMRGLLIAKAHALHLDDEVAPHMRSLSEMLKPINKKRKDSGINNCVRYWLESRWGKNLVDSDVMDHLDAEIRAFDRIEEFEEMIFQLYNYAFWYAKVDDLRQRFLFPGYMQNQRLTGFLGAATWNSAHTLLYTAVLSSMGKGLTLDQCEEVMDAVEWVNIRGWSGRDGSQFEKIYPWAAKHCLDGTPFSDWFGEFIGKLGGVLDDRPIQGFTHLSDHPVSHGSSARSKARILLHKIRGADTNPGQRSKECTSCRLLPLGGPGWNIKQEKEDHGSVSGRIGNWFLLRGVSEGDIDKFHHPIDERIKEIGKNVHTKPEIDAIGEIRNRLVKGVNWKVSDINKRSASIIKELEEHWPRDFASRKKK